VGKNFEQFTNSMVFLGGVTQWQITQHGVFISATNFGYAEITGPFKISHDAVGGTLGDSHLNSDITNTNLGLCGNRQKDMGVIGEKSPGWLWHSSHAPIVAYLMSFNT
jgi:hypothetical protein